MKLLSTYPGDSCSYWAFKIVTEVEVMGDDNRDERVCACYVAWECFVECTNMFIDLKRRRKRRR